ncbi:uncharacterized protein [Amphiura filiformis]|uniref:uncharacterized protein n=1 Tax=Amphiura filiformis TaxID=82378 RepID=UPI003B224D9A
MAEAAVLQKIKKNLLSCYICSAELKDPICLPCLHAFCFECLETWHHDSQDKTQVICPACKKSAPVPKEGIRGFPGPFLVQNLQETMDKKSAEPMQNSTCHVCGKEAEVHCVECNKGLCQACHTYHNAFTKDHHIVSIEELQSGQVTTEGRVCEVHGEQVRYYCEAEDKQVCMDCISLKTCPIEHERVTIKEAAMKQADLIDGLKKKCADNKDKFQDAIRDTNLVLDTLNDTMKQTKTELISCKEQYKCQVDQVFDREIGMIEKIYKNRVKDIENKIKELESEVGKMTEAEKLASNASTSDFMITYKYSTLSKKLNELSWTDPVAPNKSLGRLTFKRLPMIVPPVGYLLEMERWKLADHFAITEMEQPDGIGLNHDGDIVVTSFVKGVKVFSRDGQVKYSFMDDCTKITGVAVSNGNKYIVANGYDKQGLQFHTSYGKYLSNVSVYDTSGNISNLSSVAIDANDQIIAGLVNNTISIHNADGSLISKFPTETKPFRLAATSEGEIVCSHKQEPCLELMTYTGSNVRTVQSPPEVKKWSPGCVCCGHGEIFVGNRSKGDPSGIFRYTSEGNYLGCVTTQVNTPGGLALRQDGMELFVVDITDCQVKIFHRA